MSSGSNYSFRSVGDSAGKELRIWKQDYFLPEAENQTLLERVWLHLTVWFCLPVGWGPQEAVHWVSEEHHQRASAAVPPAHCCSSMTGGSRKTIHLLPCCLAVSFQLPLLAKPITSPAGKGEIFTGSSSSITEQDEQGWIWDWQLVQMSSESQKEERRDGFSIVYIIEPEIQQLGQQVEN